VNAILVPSGDHTAESSSYPGAFVRLCAPDPSRFATKISELDGSTVCVYAIWRPLGDQAPS